ncbi:hypothetical protein GCM10028807_54740 [Spirosoma daeguense]
MENEKLISESGFSERFKQFMKEFKLNTNRLAVQMASTEDENIIKRSRVKYGRWANGEVAPAYDGLCEVADKYGISLDWFATGQGEMLRVNRTSSPEVANIDYKKLFESEREETIRLRKLNERLSISILEKSGLLTDHPGSKLESSDQAAAWEEIRKQSEAMVIATEQERETIGYKPKYLTTGKVIELYPSATVVLKLA